MRRPPVLMLSCSILFAPACTEASRPAPTPSQQAGNIYSNLLHSEFCLFAGSRSASEEAKKERERLEALKKRVREKGAGPEFDAADARWSKFITTAEFTCADPAESLREFRQGLDELQIMIAKL